MSLTGRHVVPLKRMKIACRLSQGRFMKCLEKGGKLEGTLGRTLFVPQKETRWGKI